MPQRRRFAWFVLSALAPLVACMEAPNGDPGRDFASDTGGYPTYGGTGYAGASAAGSGGGGYAGATGAGTAGTTQTGAAGTTQVGTAGTTQTGTAGAPASDGGAPSGDAGGGAQPDAKGDTTTSHPAACVEGATAKFALAWSIENATGADSTCDAVGGATVDVDVVNARTGAETLARVPCASLAATTCGMAGGTYTISLKLRDASGNVLSEVFAPLMFLVDGQQTGVTSLPLQVGGVDANKARGFALTWSIDKVDTGAIETCAQAGAASVRLTAGATTYDLPCIDGKGRTAAIAPGSYPVKLDLIDGTGTTLSETQTMNIAITAGQLVFLGDVPFDVN
jgi:hypothetical protein